jgi:hypothetical protein
MHGGLVKRGFGQRAVFQGAPEEHSSGGYMRVPFQRFLVVLLSIFAGAVTAAKSTLSIFDDFSMQ